MATFYIVDQNTHENMGKVNAANGNAALLSFLKHYGDRPSNWRFNRIGNTYEMVSKSGTFMFTALQKRRA